MNAVHPLPDPWVRAPVLRAHLEPIWSYLDEDSVSEIAINRPGELFIERLGAKEMEHVVKREGAGPMVSRAGAIVQAGIPVMGHVGLTPQSATMLGGFKTQGKTAEAAQQIVDRHQALMWEVGELMHQWETLSALLSK